MDEDGLVGEVLASRYLIEERLGKGATGVVYRARHVKVGRAFAVKILHVQHELNPTLVRRFEREAELGGMVRHPNVISVVDVGETDDGSKYMVMELATGVDLATLIGRDAPMPAARVIHLIRGILEGLFHAHERGVIHRDLKPENILVEPAGSGGQGEVPRIVDFGIAIARDEAAVPESPDRLTTNGLVLGTPHYMAPEQATGVAMDHRIDLFALGVIMYEMLTGQMPFEGDGVDVARANLLEVTPPFGVRVPELSADPLLEAFTMRLMNKKPQDRPASAKAARELLDLIDRDRVAASQALGVPVPAGNTQRSAAVPPAKSNADTTRPIVTKRPAGEASWAETTVPTRAASEAGPTAQARSASEILLPPSTGTMSALETDPNLAPTRVPMPPPMTGPLASPDTLPGLGPTPAKPVAGAGFSSPSGPFSDAPARLARSSEAPPPRTEEVVPVSRSGARIAIIAVVAVALVIGIWLIAGGSSDDTKKVAAIDPPPPAHIDAGVRVEQPVVADASEPAPEPTNGSQTTPAPPPPPDDLGSPKPQQPKPVQPKPQPKPVQPKPDQPPPPPPPSADTSAKTVANMYGAVGLSLKKLGAAKGDDAVSDLWTRYRLINIQKVLSFEDERVKAYTVLVGLERDIAARSK